MEFRDWILLIVPLIPVALLGYAQYKTNARNAKSTSDRTAAQNAADDAAAVKNYAEAANIASNSLKEEQALRRDLEKRVHDLETAAARQKIRLILDLDLSSEIKITSATIERIKKGTGPLSDPQVSA